MLDAQNIADLLNDALKTDPAAITLLFGTRRACNKALADHPHIQVRGTTPEGPFNVAFIGMLNGMLSSAGSENLVAVILDDDSNQNVIGFKVVHKSEVGL